jgi:small subunit ribosomal protein S6
MVQKDGGEILDVDVWGKRYLAYKIKGHNEGYYIVYNFKVSPDKVAEIKRQMQLKQEILRFMIVEVEDTGKIGKGIKKKEINI